MNLCLTKKVMRLSQGIVKRRQMKSYLGLFVTASHLGYEKERVLDTLMLSCGCHRSRVLPSSGWNYCDFFFFPLKTISQTASQGIPWGQGTHVLIFAQYFTMRNRNINVWVSGPCILQWVILKTIFSSLCVHVPGGGREYFCRTLDKMEEQRMYVIDSSQCRWWS